MLSRIGSCHALDEECFDGDHTATLQQREQRKRRTDGPPHSQSIPKPTTSQSHMHHDRHQVPTLDMVPTTCSMVVHASMKHKDFNTTANETICHTTYSHPMLLAGEAVACRRAGTMVNKLDTTWLEGDWLGRDKQTST